MSDASVSAIDGRAVVRVGGAELLDAYVGQAISASNEAQEHEEAAQFAAATALASGRYFASRTAGETGSAVDQLFSTDDGAGILIYYRKTAGGSVEIARAITPGSLANPAGAALVGFSQEGGFLRSSLEKMRDTISVKDFGAVGDGTLHSVSEWIGVGKRFPNLTALQIAYPHVQSINSSIDWAAIQATIESLWNGMGGIATIPSGIYHLGADQLVMRSGVGLSGAGARYQYIDGVGNVLRGSWLRSRGLTTDAPLLFKSVSHCQMLNVGIDMGEAPATVAIAMGSDNNPATKELRFLDIGIFGAELGVQWGFGNALTSQEQVDSITFEGFTFNSCKNGFLINAENAADYSHIKRGGLFQMSGIAFTLVNCGFMKIEDCAMGGLNATSTMFNVTGTSPDPIRIKGCQVEPVGKFMTASGSNDVRMIILEANVINLPIEASGTLKFISENNNITSTLTTNGFVRWRSRDDVFSAGPGVRQIIINAPGQFEGRSLKDASSFNGAYLPANFKYDNTDAVPGSYAANVIVREGIVSAPFYSGAGYYAGRYVRSTVDNGRAYVVVSGDTTGSEPAFPTGAGATVMSGNVTFREAGPSAIVKGCELIQA